MYFTEFYANHVTIHFEKLEDSVGSIHFTVRILYLLAPLTGLSIYN